MDKTITQLTAGTPAASDVFPYVDLSNNITKKATIASIGGGTVTSVSVTTANGVSGSVATATTTPAITLTLGAITPTTIVASSTIAGSNLSGTNTGDQNLFRTFAVAGQSDVVADSTTDTLTLVAGTGVTITTNATTDSITINATATPITGSDTQVLFFDGANNPAGDSGFTFNKTTNYLTLGLEATTAGIRTPTAVSSNTDGGSFEILSGSGNGSGTGGTFNLQGGDGGATGNGGQASIIGGNGGLTSGNGGTLFLLAGNGSQGGSGDGANVSIYGEQGGVTGGNGGSSQLFGGDAQAGNGNGGNVNLKAGLKDGSGIPGYIILENIPASDPGVPGAIYRTLGTLMISL